jgi:heme-degrading monooxygenase HmoA
LFVHVSIHHPKPGKEQELIASMHRFGAAGSGVDGLISVHTLQDRDAGVLVGLALWESREKWEAGAGAMRAAVADDPFEEWESDVSGFRLEEV